MLSNLEIIGVKKFLVLRNWTRPPLYQYILPESRLKYNALRVVVSEIFHQFHKQHGTQTFGVPFQSLKALVFTSHL